MLDRLYILLPHFLQNFVITLFNLKSYGVRNGGNYKKYRKIYNENKVWSKEQLMLDQKIRFKALVEFAINNSSFYKNLYANIATASQIDQIEQLPIVSKEMLRKKIDDVYTISKRKGVISKTGGTTGKSLEVIFTNNNMQERFAMLDYFRSTFGYKLGKKTAWFSGKNILTSKDVQKNRFWKTDFLYKVRYYSTFHIKEEFLAYYIENLIKFKPEYFVGFPSTILEIAKYGLANNIDFPAHTVKAIFPTAETVTIEMRTTIERFFKCNVYDQYASSEGAPFIIECKNKNLHLELQSGVFEVLDENNKPSNIGKLVCTSFTTYGTPLIRYDIGDSIDLSTKTCNCGNNNPLVEKIMGRVDDFVYSIDNGKINLGNISNTLKDTKGIIKFQAEQNELSSITVRVIIDKALYTPSIEKKFRDNWMDRLGVNTDLHFTYVDEIPVEKSGKFRMVKNNIKHLL